MAERWGEIYLLVSLTFFAFVAFLIVAGPWLKRTADRMNRETEAARKREAERTDGRPAVAFLRRNADGSECGNGAL